MKEFAEKLKELRTEQGLTQGQLAAAFNTTNSSVCDWERNRAEPSLEMLVKIAGYFEVSADYLLGLED